MSRSTENRETVEASLHSDRTVGAEFEKEKSLEAQSHNKTRPRLIERIASTAGYGEYIEQAQILKEIGVKNAAKQTAKNVGQRFVLKRLSPWLFSISLSISFVQFIFATISLAGFGLQAIWYYTTQETFIGQIMGLLLSAVNFVIDLSKIMPLEYIGMIFYTLATVVGMGGFIGFTIFFHLMGIDMLRSTMSTLIFALTLALTMLPVSNMFPWLFIWVLYVVSSESSIFSMALEHHNISSDAPDRSRSTVAANEDVFETRKRA